MAHFCCFIEMLFLLLMLSRAPTIDTRPARATAHSDLIAGNEFLKLFLERDEFQRNLHSNEYQDGEPTFGQKSIGHVEDNFTEQLKNAATGRSTNSRSLDYKARRGNTNSNVDAGKQVVKLVTSGSKIVFLEEYDDDDAVVDAVAREIDLQKEKTTKTKPQKSNSSGEVKVVAVSVSSSSQRGSSAQGKKSPVKSQQVERQPYRAQQRTTSTTTTEKPEKETTTTASPKPVPTADFINHSHKSELSIEEAEPLTTSQHKARKTFLDEVDSENSASTNIQNILAAPLVQSAALPQAAAAPQAYHGSSRNSTSHSAPHINQSAPSSHARANTNSNTHGDAPGLEDKLLPFQTVIYHDTKEGHGPQSRSISYSSISQNVEDLHAWQQTGILAEAQRNISESLKPISRQQAHTHTSEPAKFYSVPSKMYGVPAKFYSEPAKVYSEPAKVYGQPEKFYSEPAKVYGQPSKFYSEPAKVYSQPSKVYGEPAKTYWPHVAAVTTSTTPQPLQTTTPAASPVPATTQHNHFQPSRRPAIVSRIAFGEAQTTAKPASKTDSASTTQATHYHHRAPSHHSNANSQSRRVLFNLDKLPYDLLNAPESSKRLLGPESAAKSSPAAATFPAVRQRPCFESSSSTAQHQHQQHQQHRQHSSLSDQHSNQNAKGLPNRDLVKCVTKYSHSSASSAGAAIQPHFTTERSHIEDLYTPTPEQNYEIEESVSVMTNGRAHGVQGLGPAPATTTTAAPATKPTRSRLRYDGAAAGVNLLHHYNANANANDEDGGAEDYNHGTGNGNGNYNYDDTEADGETDAEDGKGGSHGDGNGDDDDDSKVAYVVEGRNYRKYRVEEKTDDGFIVGEYGVVDHNDGNLRGVRYTADSTINRSVIQKALLTFLKLK